MAEEKKYIPFSVEEAKKMEREGEKLESKSFVKTEGFDKTIVFLMALTEEIWRLTQRNKSFRMELIYDAETLNTNYCFFVPTNKDESDGTNQES